MLRKRVSKKIRQIMRYSLNKKNRNRLKNSNFSIISSNCIGGIISHELGERFNSPTVNMYFSTKDFIKFLENMNYYIDHDWIDISCEKYNYPIAKIDDITIHLVHYNNIVEAKQKWDVRKKRINYNNMYIIAIERDGCTYEDIKRFDELPFENKVIFTKCNRPEIKSSYFIPNTEQNNEVIDICGYKSKISGKRWLDDYDYVELLNNVK